MPLNVCDERIRMATQSQGSLWYLNSRNVGHKEPLFRGTLGPTGLSIARFSETLGRSSYVPRLQATLAIGPDGGTLLRGWVGLSRQVRTVLYLTVIIGVPIAAGIFTVGVALLAQGKGVSALPPLLIPLALVGFGLTMFTSGMRSLRRGVPPLLNDVTTLLECPQPSVEATAT